MTIIFMALLVNLWSWEVFCKLPTYPRVDKQTPRVNTAIYDSSDISKRISFIILSILLCWFFFWHQRKESYVQSKIQEVLIKTIIPAWPELTTWQNQKCCNVWLILFPPISNLEEIKERKKEKFSKANSINICYF